ncbi:MAG: WD40 repeat domain-containing protein [Anaerolineaceae bacterium]|nr:WD40 repeat domain-containing protein [Anaerolineaceae bacterium]
MTIKNNVPKIALITIGLILATGLVWLAVTLSPDRMIDDRHIASSDTQMAVEVYPPPNPNRVVSLDWNPDGSKIVYSNSSGMVHVMDALSRQTLLTWQGDNLGETMSVDWSPDGSKIATGGFDKVVNIWDANIGRLLFTLQHVNPIDYITSVAWSPDSTRLAASSMSGTIGIWDILTAQLSVTMSASQVNAIAWSPDGSQLAAGNGVGTRIWNANTGNLLYSNRAHNGIVTDLAWSSVFNQLATSGLDKRIIVWDADTLEVIHTLTQHTDFITSLDWNSNLLASASVDGTVRIWNGKTGQSLKVIQTNAPVFATAWSPDGSQLAYGDDQIHILTVFAPQSNRTADNILHAHA